MPGFKFQEGSGIPVVWIGKEPQDIPVSNPILFVYDFDWDSCLSPWPSPKVFKKGNDFAGNADAFLDELKAHLPQKSILAGYSFCFFYANVCINNRLGLIIKVDIYRVSPLKLPRKDMG